ncbi:MAG: cytochrome c biogenesis heme-transporting ATPase CcmA [Betaproteobacteria bacterium]|nr:cytochrome c biogenesis heme-transporting ATPase CcmA [Betaproteobacteria bacterium]
MVLRGTLSADALACVRGERRLFTDLSFTLAPHTLLAVRGANGSGKTSLLRMLCGLLPPAAGTIAWNGNDIHSAREEYCAQIAYIGHLNGVKDDLSGLENLRFAARTAGIVASAASADAALRELGLNGFQRLACKTLSQGQRRRVALARLCLSAGRPLWVLDEPFTALDAAALALTQGLLESHLRRGGMVVLTTHQDAPITAPSMQSIELGT